MPNVPFNEIPQKKNELYKSSKKKILNEINEIKKNNDFTKLLRIQVESIFLKVMNSKQIPNEHYIFKPFQEKEVNTRMHRALDVMIATAMSNFINLQYQEWVHSLLIASPFLGFYILIDLAIAFMRRNTRYMLPNACTKDVEIYHKNLRCIKLLIFWNFFLALYSTGVVCYIPTLLIIVVLLNLYREIS
jgi:hypothetical protein